MGVAVGAAISVGVVINGYRFYWAVIAVFVTMMGTNNASEQVRKALFRVAGTVVGIAVGSALAHAVGHHSNYSIAVILISLFLGLYLLRVNYAFMVVGITVMVSQLYVQLGEFSNHLLIIRLEETALGAGLAIVTVTVVLPLRTRRVLQVAMRGQLQALADLIRHATEQLLGQNSDTGLRGDARQVDSAEQTLIATAQPLRRNLFGDLDRQVATAIGLAGASRNYARNLANDIEGMRPLDDEIRADLQRGCETLNTSLDTLVHAITGPRDSTYTRSAALFDRAERRLEDDTVAVTPIQLAIRDLKLIDAVLADLAQRMGLQVTNYDTATVN
jgi:uncharacterized membrane protein YccC